jgi:integrase
MAAFEVTTEAWALWGNVDLRTVQLWLGHSDMESTMRYLKPSRNQQTRDKVNEIFLLESPLIEVRPRAR